MNGPWTIAYAIRQLGRRPLFVATAVLSLALGVGINAALVQVLLEVYTSPLGVESPERLSRVEIVESATGRGFSPIEGDDFELLETALVSVAAIAGHQTVHNASVKWQGTSRRTLLDLVTPSYFRVLGVTPHLGRLPSRASQDVGGTGDPDLTSAVLSHALWRTRFNSDPSVLGKMILVNSVEFAIVGVAAPRFKGLNRWRDPKLLWLPVGARDTIFPRGRSGSETEARKPRLETVVRLGRGHGQEALAAELANLGPRLPGLRELEEKWPENLEVRATPVLRAARSLRDDQQKGTLLVLGAGALVLLLACANLGTLFLARGLQRSRELVIRRALGASSGALFRLQFSEVIVISVLSALVGLPVALVVLSHFWSLRPPLVVEGALDLGLDSNLVLIALGLAMLTPLVFSLAPSVWAVRRDSLVTARVTGRRRRFAHRLLVTTQTALATIVLVGASLAVMSLHNLRALPLGFEPERLLFYSYDFSAEVGKEEVVSQTMPGLLEAARLHPAVESASLSTMFFGATVYSDVLPEGWEPERDVFSSANGVSDEFFATLGTPVLYGRAIDSRDLAGTARVVVVGEAFAEHAWPGQSALGKRLELIDERREVVGVVADSKLRQVDEETILQVYYPLAQRYESPHVALNVRLDGEVESAGLEIARLLEKAEPDRAFTRGQWSSWVDGSLWGQRTASSLFGSLGLVALVLAGTGLYSTLSLWVTQRYPEFGVRLVTGAGPGDLVRLVLRDSMRLTGLGLIIGVPAAFAASRLGSGLLFGVSSSSPSAYAAVVLLLVLAALCGSLVPALRAQRTDPLAVLSVDDGDMP